MAASSTSKKSSGSKSSIKNGLTLIWLDDTAGQDPNAKSMFLSLFEQVFIFTEPNKCLELVESAEGQPPCMSILITGSLGEKLVHDRLQPLQQVKDIYVFCYNVAKHSQWAKHCDKVRCVESDFGKILKRLQQDVPKGATHSSGHPSSDQDEGEAPAEELEIDVIERAPERFTDDNNLYDQLALDLLLKDTDDAQEDFKKYCQSSDKGGQNDYKVFKPKGSINSWYGDNLVFLQLNSTNLNQIWALRWFLRHFYEQLNGEYVDICRAKSNFTSYYATWFNEDELTAMKHRLGQSIVSTELLHTYENKNRALKSLGKKGDGEKTHRVLLQIDVDTSIQPTVPYGVVRDREILFFFGARFELVKIELIKPQDDADELHWLIGVALTSTFDVNPSVESLYQYYLKTFTEFNDLYYAFGRILIQKGLYSEAEKWFHTTPHAKESAELAIRRNQVERANDFLRHTSEDSDDANLLRAYVHLLSSNDNIGKGRSLLTKICSEATDRIVRARANIALGFINLISVQQAEQALEYFQQGNETLRKNLPASHPDIGKSWIGIGYAYFTLQQKDRAEDAFQQALKIQRQSLTRNHPDLAKTHNGLAHCFALDKQTIKQALRELESAFEILVQTFPRDYKTHPEFLLSKQDYDKIRKGKDLHARNTLLDYI